LLRKPVAPTSHRVGAYAECLYYLRPEFGFPAPKRVLVFNKTKGKELQPAFAISFLEATFYRLKYWARLSIFKRQQCLGERVPERYTRAAGHCVE
jgi:hypothetical protein